MSTTTETPVNAAPVELAPELQPETPPAPSPEALLEAQFAGPKADLRLIYEALVILAKKVGPQGKAVPQTNCVVFVRKGIAFAVAKVGTKTRLDFALALPEQKPQLPWKASRGFGGVGRMTHKAELSSSKDIDGLLVQWLQRAYELAKPAKPTLALASAPKAGAAKAAESAAQSVRKKAVAELERSLRK